MQGLKKLPHLCQPRSEAGTCLNQMCHLKGQIRFMMSCKCVPLAVITRDSLCVPMVTCHANYGTVAVFMLVCSPPARFKQQNLFACAVSSFASHI